MGLPAKELTGLNRFEGSNPSLSAIFYEMPYGSAIKYLVERGIRKPDRAPLCKDGAREAGSRVLSRFRT